jgi:hypothetical protein
MRAAIRSSRTWILNEGEVTREFQYSASPFLFDRSAKY